MLSELKAIGVPSVAVRVDVTNRRTGARAEPRGKRTRRHQHLGEQCRQRIAQTQLNAVFLLSKLAAKSMLGRKRGRIINIGSMYSYFGSGLIPSYSAAKGAVVQLTKSMAIELAPHNIQVNAIAPGWIETDMTAPVRTMDMKSMNDEILARTPAGRWGQAEEIAGTAVYLAGRASDFVTGETIRVDGGYAIR
jgi:2-deoxy-D-gluconate 3-dehydrogenase